MAGLSLSQIEDKLNEKFAGDERKVIFWYDDKGDFADDVDSLHLKNAKLWKLTGKNQFKTKLLIEHEDTSSSYLVYAPFAKPRLAENHLEDTMLYGTRFHADRTELVMAEMHLGEDLKPLIDRHIKFFDSKDRWQRFYQIETDDNDDESLLLRMMCVLCRVSVASFDEVMRVVLSDELTDADNKWLGELARYELVPDFWRKCEKHYGYVDAAPSLTKFVVTCFVTKADSTIDETLPEKWRKFISKRPGSVVAFLDSMKNNVNYQRRYDELESKIAGVLDVNEFFSGARPESVCRSTAFSVIEKVIIKWAAERLIAEDLGAEIDGVGIVDMCKARAQGHFGMKFAQEYEMLIHAHGVISAGRYKAPEKFADIFHRYVDEDYMIDTHYRKFYAAYDKAPRAEILEKLRDLVERIYTNEYLGRELTAWNEAFVRESSAAMNVALRQRDFFARRLKGKKEKTAVIISDAMRYEVGRELMARLQDNANVEVKCEPMLGVLPSYTRLGMGALLPHDSLELTADGKELADGVHIISTESRMKVMTTHVPSGVCVQYDDIKNMKKDELREYTTGKQVIYIYHDVIDEDGHPKNGARITEACERAVADIAELVQRLANANVYFFMVTADHGFIYKRGKTEQYEKIAGVSGSSDIVSRRYIIADHAVEDTGICHLPLGMMLGNDDKRVVSFPLSYNVFQVNGGLNYVHGGSSPEELIVPLLSGKYNRGRVETHAAQVALVSTLRKVTNLETTVEFLQQEAVSDVVREARYRIYFADARGEKISSEHTYVANSRETETGGRLFRLRFSFKNMAYDIHEKYYLIVMNEDTGMEALRHEVIMDLAFAGDFGF